jgi:hypothetical protein
MLQRSSRVSHTPIVISHISLALLLFITKLIVFVHTARNYFLRVRLAIHALKHILELSVGH